MRILLISSLTSQSGSGIRFWNIARELGTLGHKVVFVERGIKGDPQKKGKSIRAFRTIDTGILPLDIVISTFFSVMAALFYRCDLVFSLKPMVNSCLPALIKKSFGVPIVLDIDDLDYTYYNEGVMRKLVRWFFEIFPHRFDKITYHNQALGELIVKDLGISPDKLYLLDQGIDFDNFIVPTDNALKDKLGFMGYQTIVYIASLGITSDFERMFPIFREIVEKRKKVKILVIGGGIRLENFRGLARQHGISGNMVFTGYLNHDEVPRYMALADLGVNYMEDKESNRCRASIKLREYLALGIPVVCNPVGDTHLFSPFVKEAKTLGDFERVILETLDRSPREKSLLGREFIEERYNWPVIVGKFSDFLSTLRTPKKYSYEK